MNIDPKVLFANFTPEQPKSENKPTGIFVDAKISGLNAIRAPLEHINLEGSYEQVLWDLQCLDPGGCG